ncbi:MAG: carboxylesterase/lipase family protein [Acetobacteraceae bacterium]|nr:carboxylesterase/lipase family protein [Acetobacteraceae bacterium]
MGSILTGRRHFLGSAGLGFALANQAFAAPRKKTEVQSVIAETSRGRVRGTNIGGIRTFKGIPYGAATDGPNRFREPRPAVPWKGIKDTVAYGPMCPQEIHPRPSYAASWAVELAMSEDCLILNIWTPALRDHHKRPVMVWIHGGGFSVGSGGSPVCDGTNLARKGDAVIVTLNHRLNIFGHLYLAKLGGTEYAESGNLGILDLVAALRWIHTNIAEFGGDPSNVTIFGQSGGGAKISTLMAMPQTRGLFQRAIVQSGSHLDGLAPEEANAHAIAFLKAVEVPVTDLPRLQRLSFEQLLTGVRKIAAGPGPRPNFSPVVDGRFLPKAPWIPDGPASSASIPMLIGSTKTETTALIGAGDPSTFVLDDASLRKKLGAWLPANDIERVIAGYRKQAPAASPPDLFFAITSARRVRQQAWFQAERKATQNAAPVWLYELDWQTPVDGGKWQSPQGLDLAFVFDNVAKSESMVGKGDEQRALAEQMSAAWLAFARTGNPNNKTLPPWPPFRAAERATMVFDVKSRVVNDFRGDERQLLAQVPMYRISR